MEIPPDEWRRMCDSVQRIEDAVVGNDKIGLTGLVKRTEVVEDKLRKLDIRLAKIIGGAGVLMYLIDRFFMP